MKIGFNDYKGFFIIEDTSVANVVDIRKGMTSLSGDEKNNKKSANKKSKNKRDEYKTDGFDVLNICWNLIKDNFDDEDEDESLQEYGKYLRSLCHIAELSNYRIDDSELSSHTTIYGQNLEGEDSTQRNDDDNEDNLQSSKEEAKRRKKLSLKERKQAREEKRLAKSNKNQRKKNEQRKKNNTSSELDLTSATSSLSPRQKINHLKTLMKQCIEAAESNTEKLSETSVIFQIDDVPFYCNDLPTLCDDEWLSDSTISWFYALIYNGFILPLLSKRLVNSKFYQYDDKLQKDIFVSPICIMLPTFTFLLANHPEPLELVKEKVLPPGISDAQFVFCPLNDNDDFGSSEGGSHWSLVVFAKLLSSNSKKYTQTAFVFDSMFQANESETNRLVKNMAKVLYNERDPKSSIDWNIIHARDTPQQTNGSDCGVFVISISSVLVSELLLLAGSTKDSSNSVTDISLSNLRFSSIDSRIWLMSTMLNCLQNATLSPKKK